MKRLAWLFVVVAITLSGRMTAQSRPDFSGTWREPSGSSLTIKQDGKTLTVTEGAQTRVYNLDGAESRFEGPSTDQRQSRMTAQARWVGSALVISTTTASAIGTWQDVEVYSLDYGPKLSVVYVYTQTTMPMMGTTVKTYTKG